jgi:hypothetical protein
VLMIARSVKSCLGGPKPNQKKNSLYWPRWDWIRRISFPSRNGTLRIYFHLVNQVES